MDVTTRAQTFGARRVRRERARGRPVEQGRHAAGWWSWEYSEDGLRYDYLVDGQRAAVVWLARGDRWEDDAWSVDWIGRGYWDSPHAARIRPRSGDEAMRLAEDFLAHPERFETPAQWQRRQAFACDRARQQPQEDEDEDEEGAPW